MKRSGYADLPLHGGHVPSWLATRMTLLGTAIVEAVLDEYGRSEVLTRLSDPFWFQALGAVMGMDWHSSGITTSVMGALKRGLNPRAPELGLYICGGRGKYSRMTPHELLTIADRSNPSITSTTNRARCCFLEASRQSKVEEEIRSHGQSHENCSSAGIRSAGESTSQ